MKRAVLILVILLPITSVAACIVMFMLASSGADLLPTPANALSKTSWQDESS